MQDSLQADLERQRKKREGAPAQRTVFQDLYGTAANVSEFFGQLTTGPSQAYAPGQVTKTLRAAEQASSPDNLRRAADELIPNPLYRKAAYGLVGLFSSDPPDPQPQQPQATAPTTAGSTTPANRRPVQPQPFPTKGATPYQKLPNPQDQVVAGVNLAEFAQRAQEKSALMTRGFTNYNPKYDVATGQQTLRDIVNSGSVRRTEPLSARAAAEQARALARDATVGIDDPEMKALLFKGFFNKLYAGGDKRLEADTNYARTQADLASSALAPSAQITAQGIATRGGVVNNTNTQRRTLLSNLDKNSVDLRKATIRSSTDLNQTYLRELGATNRTTLQATALALGGRGKQRGSSGIKPVLSTTQDYKAAVKAAGADPQARAVISARLLDNMRKAASSGQPLPEADMRLADNLAYQPLFSRLNEATGGILDTLFSGTNSKLSDLNDAIDPLAPRTKTLLDALGAELSDDKRFIKFNGGNGGITSESIPPLDLYELAREDPTSAQYIQALLMQRSPAQR